MNQPEQFAHTTPPPPAPQPAPVAGADPRIKSPAIAACLSLMPGLGQVYVGYYQRGFLHAVVVFSLVGLLATGSLGLPLLPFVALFMAFFWLYNMIDAARRAALYNRALAGGEDIELPSDARSSGIGGSIAGGASLIAFGALLLANTRFDVSLDWIEDWWPATFILVGAYLVYRAIQEKAARESSSLDE